MLANQHSWAVCYMNLADFKKRPASQTREEAVRQGRAVSVGPGAWTARLKKEKGLFLSSELWF